MKTKFVVKLFPWLTTSNRDSNKIPTEIEVKKVIDQNLKPGDPNAMIEEFLKQNDCRYNFNKLERRYESGVPKSEQTDLKGPSSVITMNLYIDENRCFKKAEVRTILTYY